MRVGSKVLVATDLSEAADEAIRQGSARARLDGGEIVVFHVVPDSLRDNPLFPQRGAEDTERLLGLERRAVDAIEARVTALTGLAAGSFRVNVSTGSAEAEIVRAADDLGATLVVVGSRGSTGLNHLLLGNVAERVVRYAHCPVLVARPHEPTATILVATDFSDPALPAVAASVEEAKVRRAKLTLLHCIDMVPDHAVGWGAPFGATWVVPPRELVEEVKRSAEQALRGELQRFGVEGDVRAATGDPASAILDAARELSADLVVVATRGRTGLRRMVLGSVAERVVAHAHCSVLAVRREEGGR
jgi:nucleotide-binding universal stress UspA family protein